MGHDTVQLEIPGYTIVSDAVWRRLQEEGTPAPAQECSDAIEFHGANELAQIISSIAFIGLAMWLIFANTSKVAMAHKATLETRLGIAATINTAVCLFSGFFNILQLTSIDDFTLPRPTQFTLDLSRPIEWIATCPIMQLSLCLLGGSRIPPYRRFMMPLMSVSVLLCGTASMFTEGGLRFAWYGFGLLLAMIMFYHNMLQIGENSEGTEGLFRGTSDFRNLSLILICTWFPFPMWFLFSPEGLGIVTDITAIHMGWVVLNIVSKFGFIIVMQRVKSAYCGKLDATRELFSACPEMALQSQQLGPDGLPIGTDAVAVTMPPPPVAVDKKLKLLIEESMSTLGMRDHSDRFLRVLASAEINTITKLIELTAEEAIDLNLPWNLVTTAQRRYQAEKIQRQDLSEEMPGMTNDEEDEPESLVPAPEYKKGYDSGIRDVASAISDARMQAMEEKLTMLIMKLDNRMENTKDSQAQMMQRVEGKLDSTQEFQAGMMHRLEMKLAQTVQDASRETMFTVQNLVMEKLLGVDNSQGFVDMQASLLQKVENKIDSAAHASEKVIRDMEHKMEMSRNQSDTMMSQMESNMSYVQSLGNQTGLIQNSTQMLANKVESALAAIRKVEENIAEKAQHTEKTIAEHVQQAERTITGLVQKTETVLVGNLQKTEQVVTDSVQKTEQAVTDTVRKTEKAVADSITANGKAIEKVIHNSSDNVQRVITDSAQKSERAITDEQRSMIENHKAMLGNQKNISEGIEKTAKTLTDTQERLEQCIEKSTLGGQDRMNKTLNQIQEKLEKTLAEDVLKLSATMGEIDGRIERAIGDSQAKIERAVIENHERLERNMGQTLQGMSQKMDATQVPANLASLLASNDRLEAANTRLGQQLESSVSTQEQLVNKVDRSIGEQASIRSGVEQKVQELRETMIRSDGEAEERLRQRIDEVQQKVIDDAHRQFKSLSQKVMTEIQVISKQNDNVGDVIKKGVTSQEEYMGDIRRMNMMMMDMVTGVQEKTSHSMTMVGQQLRTLQSAPSARDVTATNVGFSPTPAVATPGHSEAAVLGPPSSASIREQVLKAQKDLDMSLMTLGGSEGSPHRNIPVFEAPTMWSPQTSQMERPVSAVGARSGFQQDENGHLHLGPSPIPGLSNDGELAPSEGGHADPW